MRAPGSPRGVRASSLWPLAVAAVLPTRFRRRRKRRSQAPRMTGAAAQLAAAAAARRRASRRRSLQRADATRRPSASRPTAACSWPRRAAAIKVFDSLADPTPTVFADLTPQVHDFWDRGLLGMALDPQLHHRRPYVYVAVRVQQGRRTRASVPRWGDACPTPPGATGDGCVVSGRLSRLNAGGTEQVLIEDWCQQYPSHSIGSLAFGADGALYVSAGDGASFNFADYGQDGSPRQPVRRPARRRRRRDDAADRRGRRAAQPGRPDDRRPDRPRRRDPARRTRTPAPRCPTTRTPAARTPNARRIVAYGLRNPFRMTVRPGTNEIWAGDVGWNTWEEINRLPNPTGARSRNFGWPCYEGDAPPGRLRQPQPEPLRDALQRRAPARHAAPYYTYNHAARSVAGRDLPDRRLVDLRPRVLRPAAASRPAYDGALFFSDYSAQLHLGHAPPAPTACPTRRSARPSRRAPPARSTSRSGPDGDLYYVDLDGGTIRRIRYLFSNQRADRRRHRHADQRRGAADRELRRHAARATPTATR